MEQQQWVVNWTGFKLKSTIKFPFAYHTHCVAHRMSLSASQSSKKFTEVSNFFDVVDKAIALFRSSPKRIHLLGGKLPTPKDTRWLFRDSHFCHRHTLRRNGHCVVSDGRRFQREGWNKSNIKRNLHQNAASSVSFFWGLLERFFITVHQWPWWCRIQPWMLCSYHQWQPTWRIISEILISLTPGRKP